MLPVDEPRFGPVRKLIDDHQFTEAIRHVDTLLPGLKAEDRAAALYWKAVTLRCLRDAEQARKCIDDALSQPDTRSTVRICLELEDAYFCRTEGQRRL